MKFSERKGLKPVKNVIQVESVDDDLKNSIWNLFDEMIFSKRGFACEYGEIYEFSRAFWSDYLKEPADTRPGYAHSILKEIRDYYFGAEWFEVYDFVEFVICYYHKLEELGSKLNLVLEQNLAGYRLINGYIVELTSKIEIAEVEEALKDDNYSAVSKHLTCALDLLSNRTNPDCRNSIKESISAVESIARIVTKNPKATLGDALKILEKNHSLHAAFKDGFSKLYGYTSDEDGIRHAMLEEPNLTNADAIFFLVSCSAFVNYLKSKI